MRALLKRFRPSLPPVAVLVEPGSVYALRVGASKGDPTPLVRHEESFEYPANKFLPEPEAMQSIASSVLTRLGGPKRIGCVLGDTFFRTQVLTLNEFPRSEQEREKVILWHIRKFLNYPIDAVRMSYEIVGRAANSVTLFVTLCPAEDVRALESAFASGGCQVGYVGSATVELFNLALAKGAVPSDGNVLIINRTLDYLSFLFAERGAPLFFRCKEVDGRQDEGEQVNERLLQELRLTLAYYREKLGGGPLNKILIRRYPLGAYLPLEEVLDEEVRVEDFADVLPPLPSGGTRETEYLPLFGILEGAA